MRDAKLTGACAIRREEQPTRAALRKSVQLVARRFLCDMIEECDHVAGHALAEARLPRQQLEEYFSLDLLGFTGYLHHGTSRHARYTRDDARSHHSFAPDHRDLERWSLHGTHH